MIVGELKKLLENVPNDFIVGYTKNEIINENFHGTYMESLFNKMNVIINANFNKKELSLFTI